MKRLAALLLLVPCTASATYIYDISGELTEVTGDLPFSVGDPFTATFYYSPERIDLTADPYSKGVMSYYIQLGEHSIAPWDNGQWVETYPSDILDDTPQMSFSSEENAIAGWALFGDSFPTASELENSLLGKFWYLHIWSDTSPALPIPMRLTGDVHSVSLVQVPEPSTLWLSLAFAPLLFRKRLLRLRSG